MDRAWYFFLFYESLWGNDDYLFVSLVKRNPVEKINEKDLERVFNLVDEYLMKPMKQFVDLSTSSCFGGSDWCRSPRSSEYKEHQWRIASEDEWSEQKQQSETDNKDDSSNYSIKSDWTSESRRSE